MDPGKGKDWRYQRRHPYGPGMGAPTEPALPFSALARTTVLTLARLSLTFITRCCPFNWRGGQNKHTKTNRDRRRESQTNKPAQYRLQASGLGGVKVTTV